MTKIRTVIGYIAYRATADELAPIGGKGVCDSCNRYSYHGYLIPVLNSYYCPECYRDFCSRARFYPDDIGHETRVAAYYESKIPLEGKTQ